jgi:hypothetical protein
MPFHSSKIIIRYGTPYGTTAPNTYCQADTAASDYGKCYNVYSTIFSDINPLIFVQSDTSKYPVGSLPCEVDKTCIRYTSTTAIRVLISPLFNYSNKQAIVTSIYSRSHSNINIVGNVIKLVGHPIPSTGTDYFDTTYSFLFPANNYEATSWPIYDPVGNWKAHLNPYTITSGRVFVLRWSGTFLTPVLHLVCMEDNHDNIWYSSDIIIRYAYESSPLALIQLNYDKDYAPYQELRNAFGYSYNGVDQPGWNTDDIISVLKELFPDRAWAVFDDRTYTLYLYNLTADYIPDWLVEKLTPISMKVLKQPADSSAPKAWLDELNRRNAYSTPPSAEV